MYLTVFVILQPEEAVAASCSFPGAARVSCGLPWRSLRSNIATDGQNPRLRDKASCSSLSSSG